MGTAMGEAAAGELLKGRWRRRSATSSGGLLSGFRKLDGGKVLKLLGSTCQRIDDGEVATAVMATVVVAWMTKWGRGERERLGTLFIEGRERRREAVQVAGIMGRRQ